MPRTISLRRIAAELHAWLGALGALFILLVSLTGMLIAFSAPLLNIETDAFPATKARDSNAPVDLSALVSSASIAAGENFIPLGYLGANAEIATNVEMIYGLSDSLENNGETQIISFDPSDDSVAGALYLDRTLTHLVIELHYELIAGETGKFIVALVGLLMSALAIIGLYLWWPRKSLLMNKLRSSVSPKKAIRSNFNIHSQLGFVFAIVILVWSLTGVYWLKPNWGPSLIRPSTETLSNTQIETLQKANCGDNITLASASEIVRLSHPNTVVHEVEFSAPWQPYYVFYLRTANDVDKKDGDIRTWVSSQCDGMNYSASVNGLEVIGASSASIHSGESFGSLRIPIILLVGLILCAISITGLILWSKRLTMLLRGLVKTS